MSKFGPMLPESSDTFVASAWDYAKRDFVNGDFRSRSTFLARVLTWPFRHIVRGLARRQTPAELDQPRTQIAVETGGGLGDMLSTLLFVQTLFRSTRRPDIDLFYAHKSHLDFACSRNPFVRGYLPASCMGELQLRYDAIIHVHRLVRYDLRNHVRLSRLCPELFWLRDAAERNTGEFSLHMREMPLLDGDLAKRAVLRGLNRKSLLGYSGGLQIGGDDAIFLSPDPAALKILESAGLESGRYITIHDGFDTFHRIRSLRSTKQWTQAYWQDVIDGLRHRQPGMKIVQLGGGHSQPYRGLDANLVDKASFDEVAWLLKHAACHVDGESGLVRVAREMGGRSVVVFGPTDPDFFGFPDNINVLPEKCGNCFWSTPEWLAQCPRGMQEPECTRSVTPDRVLNAIDAVVEESMSNCPSGLNAKVFGRTTVPNGPAAAADRMAERFVPELVACLPTGTASIAVTAPASSGLQFCSMIGNLGHIECTWFHIAEAGADRHAWRQTLQANTTHEIGDRPANRTPRVKEIVAGQLNVPSHANAFDLVLLVSAFGSRMELEFSLREMLRILRPGGSLVLVSSLPDDLGHYDAPMGCFSHPPRTGLIQGLDIAAATDLAANCLQAAGLKKALLFTKPGNPNS